VACLNMAFTLISLSICQSFVFVSSQ
jgi:hypothetical protein